MFYRFTDGTNNKIRINTAVNKWIYNFNRVLVFPGFIIPYKENSNTFLCCIKYLCRVHNKNVFYFVCYKYSIYFLYYQNFIQLFFVFLSFLFPLQRYGKNLILPKKMMVKTSQKMSLFTLFEIPIYIIQNYLLKRFNSRQHHIKNVYYLPNTLNLTKWQSD